MKNIISILLFTLLMSCNSSTNQTQNKPIEKASDKKISETLVQPKVEKPNNIFEGMYTYMADTNMFISCDEKTKMSIAMEGEYLNLERQYLRTVDDGEEVFLKLKGKIKKVPAMEGDGKIDALVIGEILELSKDKKCD